MISRMRLTSLPRTVACAEKVMDTTMTTYFAANKTIRELHDLTKSGVGIDPLKEFSEAAREELGGVQLAIARRSPALGCWPASEKRSSCDRHFPWQAVLFPSQVTERSLSEQDDPRMVAFAQLLIAGVKDGVGCFSQGYVGGVVGRKVVAQFPNAAQQ